MQDRQYIDLLINNGDIQLNTGNEPVLCDNRVSVAQDIVHAILESGLANQLIGERSRAMLADIYIQITLLIETDTRIIPGSIFINDQTSECLLITADTYEFGLINLQVTL